LRQGSAVWEQYFARAQHHQAALERESAPGEGEGGGRGEAAAGLQQLFEGGEGGQGLKASVQRSAFSVQRSAFSVQRSAFSVQRSAFSVQRSAFSVQRSAFSVSESEGDRFARLPDRNESGIAGLRAGQ
jgi:hypothetical protein